MESNKTLKIKEALAISKGKGNEQLTNALVKALEERQTKDLSYEAP